MSDQKPDFSEYGNVQSPMDAIESLVVAFVTAGLLPPTKITLPKGGKEQFNLLFRAKVRKEEGTELNLELNGSPLNTLNIKAICTYHGNVIELVEEE
jgi:hypothetical protein